mgnify:CR=1 FL=1
MKVKINAGRKEGRNSQKHKEQYLAEQTQFLR